MSLQCHEFMLAGPWGHGLKKEKKKKPVMVQYVYFKKLSSPHMHVYFCVYYSLSV